MNVVVVGGGIVGLACAYYLRQRDIEVTVFEQDRIGHGSTPRAGGGIRLQFSTPTSIALSKHSIEIWERFREEFNTDINYRQHGYLYLARTESTAAAIRDNVNRQNAEGVPSEYIDPAEAAKYCPGLHTDAYVGATYCPRDGYADPERALHGYALMAAQSGARICLGQPVTDLTMDGDRVTGVRTNDEDVSADFVINAAGAWSPHVATMAGLDLPITPERRQLVVVRPESPVEADAPFVTDLDTGAYFRPQNQVEAYVGGHFDKTQDPADPDTFRRDYDPDWAQTAIAAASEVADYFGAESTIDRGWAGLYAMTPDHHPIIDEVIPGFVVAAGFSGHGFMQSPATGQVVTELIADGTVSIMDVSPLQADRFDRGKELHEVFYSA